MANKNKEILKAPGPAIQDLIEAVRIRPHIWNTSHRDYSNRYLRVETWKQIAQELCTNYGTATTKDAQDEIIKSLRTRWGSVRSQKMKKSNVPYIYDDILSFLIVDKPEKGVPSQPEKELPSLAGTSVPEEEFDPEGEFDPWMLFESEMNTNEVTPRGQQQNSGQKSGDKRRCEENNNPEVEIKLEIKEEKLIASHQEPDSTHTLQKNADISLVDNLLPVENHCETITTVHVPISDMHNYSAVDAAPDKPYTHAVMNGDPDKTFFNSTIKPHMQRMSADVKLDFHFEVLKLLRNLRPGPTTN
ncbi:uncharacterized protein LOC108602472 [Drosophila busckii]|uniref:uncharacterized protein LOC108602472 n=1 Tax=Drosophila busckii TaxID=30019 RepID=UPI00083F3345|nr:uncharacterized protein LOC108602472 [Drosophila busckii]